MSQAPSFSIVVPTRDRPEALRACLASLAALDYPADRFDVVLVDDGSRCDLRPVVEPLHSRLALTLLRRGGDGPAAARNAGAAAAQGDWLAFTDDDCTVAPDWLTALARAAARGDALIGGRVENGRPDNPYSSASQQLIGYLYRAYNESGGEPRFFCSNNMCAPAGRFRALEGFDERYPRAAGEDRDLCDRWRHAGLPLRYERSAVVRHAHRLTLRHYLAQHFGYGRAAWTFHRRRAARDGRSLRVEPLRFYTGLLRQPFSAQPGGRPWRQAALLALSQLANAAGFFWQAGRARLPGRASGRGSGHSSGLRGR